MIGSVFFLVFGIILLISSYRLNDPFSFVLTFFASNLIILISAVILLGLVYRSVVAGMRTDAQGNQRRRII